ncbi:MAG: hypothetical protein LBR80_10855 [Deltaproteobacteria bacterium]|nr:hypothetical protein [Deltaproteobacteria bacterium]
MSGNSDSGLQDIIQSRKPFGNRPSRACLKINSFSRLIGIGISEPRAPHFGQCGT